MRGFDAQAAGRQALKDPVSGGCVNREIPKPNLLGVGLVVLSWFVILEFVPYLNRLFDFRRLNENIIPAVRMTLMFLATYAYVSRIEKKSFAAGFNFSFRKIGKNIIWAFIFSWIALAVLAGYQFLIVRPLASKTVEASAAASEGVSEVFSERLIVYVYVVYEGIIEVLIFIGFLLDRLAIRWGWAGALAVGNLCFALWHYGYWRNGLLEGTLMVVLTFMAGVIISLSYLKTKNSLSPTICHFLVDSPMAIRELLGMVV